MQAKKGSATLGPFSAAAASTTSRSVAPGGSRARAARTCRRPRYRGTHPRREPHCGSPQPPHIPPEAAKKEAGVSAGWREGRQAPDASVAGYRRPRGAARLEVAHVADQGHRRLVHKRPRAKLAMPVRIGRGSVGTPVWRSTGSCSIASRRRRPSAGRRCGLACPCHRTRACHAHRWPTCGATRRSLRRCGACGTPGPGAARRSPSASALHQLGQERAAWQKEAEPG